MQELQQTPVTQDEEVSIFDDMEPLPELYSAAAIFGFSFWSGTLFGAILLAMNMHRLDKEKDVSPVVLFGGLYMVAAIALGNTLHTKVTGVSLLVNLLGAYIMRYYFWNRYIGKDTPYRKRSITTPLIIAIAIIGLMTVLILYSSGTIGR